MGFQCQMQGEGWYVLNFSRALGVELKERKIHVMAVAPGWIKTEFFEHAVHDDTIKYYDKFYTSEQVVDKAMKDMRKGKTVSLWDSLCGCR